MSTKIRTILAWIFGISFIVLALPSFNTYPFGSLLILVAGAILLPPVAQRLANKISNTWRIVLAVVLVLVGLTQSAPKQLVQNSAPVIEQVVTVSSKSLASFVYDVPALIGKNVDEIKAVLGKPSDDTELTKEQMRLGATEWSKTFKKGGQELLVTYDSKTRKVVDFFISTNDPSGGTSDMAKLMEIGNLLADDARYKIEFVKALTNLSVYTGVKIIPL